MCVRIIIHVAGPLWAGLWAGTGWAIVAGGQGRNRTAQHGNPGWVDGTEREEVEKLQTCPILCLLFDSVSLHLKLSFCLVNS